MTLHVVNSLSLLKQFITVYQRSGETIGFVPTMGALHQGHLSLMQRSKQEQKKTVVSIFVNPLQFGPNEDFEKYPRDLEVDRKLCESVGVDLILACSPKEIYPSGYSTYVEVEHLDRHLCGESRPGHFRGVTTVVCKLFHLVEPDIAYFGKKDAQQCLILQKMVMDLNMNLALTFCETVRESDGLAMSSRNQFLSSAEREQAICLKKALNVADVLVQNGERNSSQIKTVMTQIITSFSLARIDYIEIVSQQSLQPISILEKNSLIALAVFFGSTRLIDNLWIQI